MPEITLLSQETIDKIAAGEVVERPSSVVKELVENAIDAKATAVTVEIKEGGISFIRITDNGCGIERAQVPLAFLRHSTSKIKSVEDLMSITSLGFRGEALSSIAAVSQVELITKTYGELTGTRYVIEGSKEKENEEIGAPPGYVGYEEGGQLTEAVRRKPYSVVLFDEVEKAHPDVFNILLQVLDDGRITDSQGRTVDFKNTVIILTSNLGSDIILNDLEQRRAQGSNELSDEAKHQIDLLLRSKFRPEFLNRLDEIVYYKSLTKDEMRKIVDLQLADLRSRMDEGKHLNLDVTTAAKDYIIDSAYDSVYGARPIKRFIQSRVETLIAKAIIQGRYAEGSTLTVDYDGNALVLK